MTENNMTSRWQVYSQQVFPTNVVDGFPEGRRPTWSEAARLYSVENSIGSKIFATFAMAAGLELPATFLNDLSGVGVVDDVTGLFTMAGFGAVAATAALGIAKTKFQTVAPPTPDIYNKYMAAPLPVGEGLRRYVAGHGKAAFAKLASGLSRVTKAAVAVAAEGTAAAIPGQLDDVVLVTTAAAIITGALNYRNPFHDNPEGNKHRQVFRSLPPVR